MKLNIVKIGKIDYKEALDIQEQLQIDRLENKIDDTLLLLEHYPVITLGKRGKYSNIKIQTNILKENDVNVYEVSRGGDVTYHGPGQLVGYLIFDLKNHGKDIKNFVWKIQEVFIRFMKMEYGIESYRDDGVYTGVWVGNDKITAIGIAISHWVTMHGFAFNINTDLDHYKWINPCGITDKGITSLEKLSGSKQNINYVTDKIVTLFCEIFGMESNYIELNAVLKRECDYA
jgi:lipoyl(octanoyl) transferase